MKILFLFMLLASYANARSFLDYCENSKEIDILHTVDVLLKEFKANDCLEGDQILKEQTRIWIYKRDLTNLRPIEDLINVLSLREWNHLSEMWHNLS